MIQLATKAGLTRTDAAKTAAFAVAMISVGTILGCLALLSHADRSRVFGGSGPTYPRGATIGSLLVDGFYRADWKLEGATLTITGLDGRRGRDAMEDEGLRLVEFLVPGAADRRVEFSPTRP